MTKDLKNLNNMFENWSIHSITSSEEDFGKCKLPSFEYIKENDGYNEVDPLVNRIVVTLTVVKSEYIQQQ